MPSDCIRNKQVDILNTTNPCTVETRKFDLQLSQLIRRKKSPSIYDQNMKNY